MHIDIYIEVIDCFNVYYPKQQPHEVNQPIQLLKIGEQMKNSPYSNMKQILLILAVVALVGCGEREYTNTRDLNPNNPPPSQVAKPVRKLTEEEEKVVGEYELELKKFGETHRYVLLDNSTVEYYLDGKKEEAEHKWSIVDKEVHIERENRAVSVFRINKDESITGIATIDEGGKRKEILKEHQYSREKIK